MCMTKGAALLLLLFACEVQAQEALPLTAAPTASRVLAPGATDVFRVDLPPDTFVYGEVLQQSVDVEVWVYDPAGALVDTFDGAAQGPESFHVVSREAGAYRVEVTPYEEGTGRYAVQRVRLEPVAATPAGRVDQILAAYDHADRPGAAVAVVHRGQTVHASGYGRAHLEYEASVTPETVFYIGSVGKQFTTFAIALLAERGQLSLDDEVRTHVPELHDFGSPITIRHLIHHTSGLRDYFGLLRLSGTRSGDLVTQAHILDVIARQRELNYAPGAEFVYSNSNYALLATVVERVTGQSFGDWMQDQVFAPLGMTQALIGDDHQEIIPQRAASYSRAADGSFHAEVFPYSGYGAGGVYASATDLVRWVQNYETPTVGTAATQAQMRERGVLTTGDTLGYAFALNLGAYRGVRLTGHSGALAGYRSYVGHFPDHQLSVIVLTNRAEANPQGLAMQIAEVYLPASALAPEPALPPRPQASEAPPSPPDLELMAFEGAYYSAELGTTYVLAIEEGTLMAHHPRQAAMPLTPHANDTFRAPWPLGEVTFQRDAMGEVEGLRVTSGRVRHLWFERRGD
ncbi:MAG: serine hydrolase domain-containing protein [Bacteroidota bacterium]